MFCARGQDTYCETIRKGFPSESFGYFLFSLLLCFPRKTKLFRDRKPFRIVSQQGAVSETVLFQKAGKDRTRHIWRRFAALWACMRACARVYTHAPIAWCLSSVALSMPVKLRHRDVCQEADNLLIRWQILIRYIFIGITYATYVFSWQVRVSCGNGRACHVDSRCRNVKCSIYFPSGYEILRVVSRRALCPSYFQFVIHSKHRDKHVANVRVLSSRNSFSSMLP